MATAGFRVAPIAASTPRGICRACGEPVTDRDGQPQPGKRWHRDCVKAYNASRHPEYLRHLVWLRDHGRCAHCGAPSRYGWEADHIVPVAEGGRSVIENMQTLCLECHGVKSGQEATQRAAERRGGHIHG